MASRARKPPGRAGRPRAVAELVRLLDVNQVTQLLTAGLADELHLVIAPFFVGDSTAPRFVNDGSYPWNHSNNRARLVDTRQLGDVVLLPYAISPRYGQA